MQILKSTHMLKPFMLVAQSYLAGPAFQAISTDNILAVARLSRLTCLSLSSIVQHIC